MTLKQYILLAQVETTTTSIFPALIGILYAWYNYDIFRLGFSILGLLTVVIFHLAVNIRDNYLDYYIADNKNADHAQDMTVGKENIPLKNVRIAYYISGAVALVIGLYLVFQTSIILLVIGFIGGMLIGVLYTAGPRPISSTPTGEFFIGVSMGFGIFASMVYVNAFDVMTFDLVTTGQLIVASIPTSITVMAILLANNICDLEEDIEDNRFTLPYHIGVDKALVVFKWFYYAAYTAVILSVVFGTFPRLVNLSLLTFPYVLKNIRIFTNHQDKQTTFMTTIINSAVIPVPIIITLFLGAWLNV
ncbi:1,4-dihydroxy-2-naphthoate octaprenyltransferase [Alkalibacterium subtropicum]|uniref:1,4-dihydroxy-2-naphthoate octaprenyltransferase n=1 Tax=Alkalibacterium subtropicum TaxID=753702 RepID=A0A1I1L8M3_9LACT|nr:UbiA family prenyltransferase [Alkalibacterium subtropicum]SFC66743.1 1,4-dihydroxy-2-naphthoate octaprenyltransferase [Alkalibacterium subtropicum]